MGIHHDDSERRDIPLCRAKDIAYRLPMTRTDLCHLVLMVRDARRACTDRSLSADKGRCVSHTHTPQPVVPVSPLGLCRALERHGGYTLRSLRAMSHGSARSN